MRQFRIGAKYDPDLDAATWKSAYNPIFVMRNMPGWKKELIYKKNAGALRKYKAKIREPEERKRIAREAVELEAAALVCRVAGALQAMLQQLNDTPIPRGQYQRHVNFKRLHNVLMELRTKCGVTFEADAEFDRKIPLAPHGDEQNPIDIEDIQRENRENQRAARLMEAKRTAEKLTSYINKNRGIG